MYIWRKQNVLRMKRNILLFLVILFVGVVKASSGISVGYCGGMVSKEGCIPVEGEGWTHVSAILTSDMLEPYVGNKITSVRVGLASRLNVDTLTVWVRNKMDGNDIASGKVVFGEGQSIVRGWNEITLDKQVEIEPLDDICIGYSFHHNKNADVISAIGTPVENSFFIKTGDEWEDKSALGALSIEAIVTGGDFANYDLALKEVYGMKSSQGGVNFTALVENKGMSDVNTFEIITSVDGFEDVYKQRFDKLIPSNSSLEIKYNISIPEKHEAGTKNRIKTVVSCLEGTDEKTDNNEVFVNYSYKRCVLVEEFTSESCGNCPRASKALEELMSDSQYSGKIIPVMHHSGYYEDWLTCDADIAYTWFYNSKGTFAPAMMYDRCAFFLSDGDKGNPTPAGKVPDKEHVKKYIDKRLETFSHVTFDMTAEYDNKVTLTVRITGERDKRFSKTDERITVYLLEDNIKARNQNGADDNYIHNYVLRAWNSIWGDVIEWNNNSFEYECQLTLNPYWIKKNLHITAFVSSYDWEDPAACTVENARDMRFEAATGIEEIVEGDAVVLTEWYTLDGRKTECMDSGFFIERRVYASGKEEIRKIMR